MKTKQTVALLLVLVLLAAPLAIASTITSSLSGGGGGAGMLRSVNAVSADTAAGSTASTDYVYLVTGAHTITLPTAVGNKNLYTVKRVGSGTTTIATTSAQTIDGSATVALTVQYQSLSFISDGTNWNIL